MTRVVAALALVLAACNQAGDPAVCGNSITQRPEGVPETDADKAQAAYACVEQWSARFARGDDPARDIATAVVSACNQEIARAVTGSIEGYGRTIEIDPAITSYWRGHSMFIAMQVRAGDCYKDV